ncbi:MAG: S41 family peptidase [Bacteroidales bacterium]
MNRIYASLLLIVALFVACQPDDKLDSSDNSNNGNQTGDEYPKLELTKNVFDYYYLWYETLPSTIDYSSYDDTYESINKWIDDVKYEKDRWSFAMSYTDFSNYYSGNASESWDAFFFLVQTNSQIISGQNYMLFVREVQKDGAFGKAGYKRGDIIASINGKSIDDLSNSEINSLINDNSSLSFGFYKNGEIKEATLAKSNYTMNTVLKDTIYNVNNAKVGYLAFSEFISTSKAELENVFADFKSANVSDVILDIRYNGGGQVDVAEYMCNIFAGNSNNRKLMYKTTHNNKNTTSDESTYFSTEANGLNLSRLFVITTNRTASASEMVINSLTPYMTVLLVGDTTHGKPVGMEPRYNEKLDWIVAPITMSDVNADGYGGFFDGLPVNKKANDNYTVDWGDTNDDCIHQALYYIENGSFEEEAAISRKSLHLDTKVSIATRQKAQGMLKAAVEID